jgi:ABC-type Fe3+-hydroxamate transport system substrate-binding protein
MKEVRDHLDRPVRVVQSPRRVISLVPSQSELLYDLGIKPIGVTKFCIHPASLRTEGIIVGGTKRIHTKLILDLKPDLVIGNKEENVEEQIAAIWDRVPVWISNVQTTDDSVRLIEDLGALFGLAEVAQDLKKRLAVRFDEVRGIGGGKRVLYLIWSRPWMGAGTGTYIDSMLSMAGWVNVLAEAAIGRYPELNASMIKMLKPEVILLSSEPYPFKESDIALFKKEFPECDVQLADGEFYSWYGTRLIHLKGH